MKIKFSVLVGIIYVCSIRTNVAASGEEKSHVEVRAVFLNCEPIEREPPSIDNEATRFEREESFKHCALHDCTKKIALTVKLANEPNSNSGDEYIPIEHVFQGSKRVRLLDPYVLRLRREKPIQAYKIKKIDTICGLLTYGFENGNNILQRFRRNSDPSTPKVTDMDNLDSRYSGLQDLKYATSTAGISQIAGNCAITAPYANSSSSINKRDKRNDYNIVMMEDDRDISLPHVDRRLQRIKNDNPTSDVFDESSNEYENYNNNKKSGSLNNYYEKTEAQSGSSSHSKRNEDIFYQFDEAKDTVKPDWDRQDKKINKIVNNQKHFNKHKYFTMYSLEKPVFWSDVQVQLFKKFSTPEGNTMWNDITKGEPASVSSLSPEWSNQDMNVQYRVEWVPRDDFPLPASGMCLLVADNNNNYELGHVDRKRQYIVVPKEDVMSLVYARNDIKKRMGNYSDLETDKHEQCRRAVVRMARAIVDNNQNELFVQSRGGEQYLTIPFSQPHQAQIDIEARADNNQPVEFGSSGRIMTVVSDNSRHTRTVLNVQISNTGLAASRFRVKTRDCSPDTLGLENEKESSEDSLLLPPRHTRNIRLVVPYEIPTDVARCTVALENDNGNSVAVRDVTVKRGDRCFCVWHCECVCLSEDPKLLCQEMSEARQVAAGLSLRGRIRRARSCCYKDLACINFVVTFIGVLFVLLALGLVKAIAGLACQCMASCGLQKIVKMPRKIDRYYESTLQDRSVVYDDEGWPVHPDTKERTVRIMSRPMEFILNMLFFVMFPCVTVCDVIKQVYNNIMNPNCAAEWKSSNNDKKCFSSQDIQMKGPRRHRRRGRLTRWMTAEAEELSSNIWQKGLQIEQNIYTPLDNLMQPLFCDEIHQDATANLVTRMNSDEDDTEYVLMQMQKSRESIVKCKKHQGVDAQLAQRQRPKSNRR